jgi:periplasmic divalent cation tolerance protein
MQNTVSDSDSSVEVAAGTEAATALLIITTVPDESTGVKIGKALVDDRLAACVHVMPLGRSIYRWQGTIEEAIEATLLVKTSSARYSELERRLRDLHPYDVPELIALPIEQGHAAYLNWIFNETSPET